jgi:hypothetical protein
MPCRPMHISLEVDPSAQEKITVTLDKTCDDQDEATWKITFQLQEGNPLATVVNFSCELDPENHPKAEATVNSGQLDDAQQGQSKIAAGVHKDPDATDDDKNAATQKIVGVKQMLAPAPAGPSTQGN